jgi:hypothetical protein
MYSKIRLIGILHLATRILGNLCISDNPCQEYILFYFVNTWVRGCSVSELLSCSSSAAIVLGERGLDSGGVVSPHGV